MTSSKEFLNVAEGSIQNAVNFRNIANTLSRFLTARPLAIFCLLTSIEVTKELNNMIFS